jgi:hypothetical protein
MGRLILSAILVTTICSPATAEIWGFHPRIDHALWPDHDQKLVVAGEIVAVTSKREFRFQVADVILGADSYRGRTLTIRTSVIWPEALTPFQKGTSCLLLIRPSKGRLIEEYHFSAVVPGQVQDYPAAADSLEARTVLADELLAQLMIEKSEKRQRALLLQLAPILSKDKAESVEGFLSSADPWVRRSALVALVYSTEDPRFLEAAAKDVQAYFDETKEVEEVESLKMGGWRVSPQSLLLEHYFFLARRSWTWGSMWNEMEAEKHLRIVDGMLKLKIFDEATRKRLLENEK